MRYLESFIKHQKTPQPAEFSDKKLAKILLLRHLYLEQNLTAREVCLRLGMPEEEFEAKKKRIQKYFHLNFPKGLGRGGARKNSGNKKGIKFPNRKKNTNTQTL